MFLGLYYCLLILIKLLFVIIPILISVAFLTLVERKVLASFQRRVGPDSVGFMGFLQPFADAIKLLLKEYIFLGGSDKIVFFLSPMVLFVFSFLGWLVIPFFNSSLLDLNLGVLYILVFSSLSAYGIFFAGWSSNSKYAMLGSLRSVSQLISYEVSIGLIFISIFLCVKSFRLIDIVEFQRFVWLVVPLFPLAILCFLSILAETSRIPFDLPEAEAELVSGYNVEYSSVGFVLFFVSEYSNIILMSFVFVLLFFGGWLSPFFFFYSYCSDWIDFLLSFYSLSSCDYILFLDDGDAVYYLLFLLFIFLLDIFFLDGIHWLVFKVLIIIFLFLWIRGVLPRYRYDQLMYLGWKVVLPMVLSWLFFISSILVLL